MFRNEKIERIEEKEGEKKDFAKAPMGLSTLTVSYVYRQISS